MKKIALAALVAAGFASSAFAADMPLKAPAPMAVATVYNWSGFYVGGQLGGGWGRADWYDPDLGGTHFSSHHTSGFLGGGVVGYNWQMGSWVFGVQADGNWADLKGSALDTLSNGGLSDHTRVESLGTVTGRIGYAWDRSLFYGKGGYAWAHDKYDTFRTSDGATFYSASNTRSGWTLGVGYEAWIAPNWSWKIEYDYLDFGKSRSNFTGGIFAGIAPFDIRQTVQTAMIGINYHFDWARTGVVAKY